MHNDLIEADLILFLDGSCHINVCGCNVGYTVVQIDFTGVSFSNLEALKVDLLESVPLVQQINFNSSL